MSISTGRVAENRRARHDYQIEETLEAGIILQGSGWRCLMPIFLFIRPLVIIAQDAPLSLNHTCAGEDQGRLALFNANIPVYPASA